jgi:serine/threonine protein kinase
VNAIDTTAEIAAPFRDDLVYDSERTRVWRRYFENPPHCVVVKQPLGPDATTRLHREIRILQRLRDVEGVTRIAPGIAPHGMLLLENRGGTRLADAPTGEHMTASDQVRVMLQLVRIVSAVHARGVVHKDINPVHILLCGEKREPLLVHFELATTSAEEHSAFVHHRNIAGTLAYLAPELTGRTGRSVDQRADLYALGASFYELSTGQPPFADSDPLRLVHDVLVRVPVAPIELRPNMPHMLSAIVMRLLEKEPDRRYQSADGLAHDLARLAQDIERGANEPFELGERDFAPRLLAPSRLVGREKEVHALQAAIRSSVEEGGQSVLICGRC